MVFANFCQKKEELSSNSNDGADSQIIRESDSLNNSNIGRLCSEADLGLLQHPRWSAL